MWCRESRSPSYKIDQCPLVQQQFPIGWNSPCGSRYGLIFGMRMWRKQLRALDHPLFLVIVEPILTRLEAGNDRMPSRCCMLGCMLARRTVAATDVPTLHTPAEMKPPICRRRQAFQTSDATWLGSGVDSPPHFFHFQFSFRVLASKLGFERVPYGVSKGILSGTKSRGVDSVGCSARLTLAALPVFSFDIYPPLMELKFLRLFSSKSS